MRFSSKDEMKASRKKFFRISNKIQYKRQKKITKNLKRINKYQHQEQVEKKKNQIKEKITKKSTITCSWYYNLE